MYIFDRSALFAILAASFILAGCGSGSDTPVMGNDSGNGESGYAQGGGEGSGSNIPYLRENHANYTEHGSTATPAPVKDTGTLSINWIISAKTETDATMLADHINFMKSKLEEGENPRAFDKLFLMEAYMKVNHYYTTSVEQSGTTVVISKVAKNSCAYKVISAHSDAVSGDFFAQGNITKDYSSVAEGILADSACDALRSDIETYIAERKKP